MGTMNALFEEREVRERAAGSWWVFLLTGIAWLIFALIVFQWDYTTIAAILPTVPAPSCGNLSRVRPRPDDAAAPSA